MAELVISKSPEEATSALSTSSTVEFVLTPKTGVMLLNKIMSKEDVTCTIDEKRSGPDHDPLYECTVKLRYKTFSSVGMGKGSTKKIAKNDAAFEAIVFMESMCHIDGYKITWVPKTETQLESTVKEKLEEKLYNYVQDVADHMDSPIIFDELTQEPAKLMTLYGEGYMVERTKTSKCDVSLKQKFLQLCKDNVVPDSAVVAILMILNASAVHAFTVNSTEVIDYGARLVTEYFYLVKLFILVLVIGCFGALVIYKLVMIYIARKWKQAQYDIGNAASLLVPLAKLFVRTKQLAQKGLQTADEQSLQKVTLSTQDQKQINYEAIHNGQTTFWKDFMPVSAVITIVMVFSQGFGRAVDFFKSMTVVHMISRNLMYFVCQLFGYDFTIFEGPDTTETSTTVSGDIEHPDTIEPTVFEKLIGYGHFEYFHYVTEFYNDCVVRLKNIGDNFVELRGGRLRLKWYYSVLLAGVVLGFFYYWWKRSTKKPRYEGVEKGSILERLLHESPHSGQDELRPRTRADYDEDLDRMAELKEDEMHSKDDYRLLDDAVMDIHTDTQVVPSTKSRMGRFLTKMGFDRGTYDPRSGRHRKDNFESIFLFSTPMYIDPAFSLEQQEVIQKILKKTLEILSKKKINASVAIVSLGTEPSAQTKVLVEAPMDVDYEGFRTSQPWTMYAKVGLFKDAFLFVDKKFHTWLWPICGKYVCGAHYLMPDFVTTGRIKGEIVEVPNCSDKLVIIDEVDGIKPVVHGNIRCIAYNGKDELTFISWKIDAMKDPMEQIGDMVVESAGKAIQEGGCLKLPYGKTGPGDCGHIYATPAGIVGIHFGNESSMPNSCSLAFSVSAIAEIVTKKYSSALSTALVFPNPLGAGQTAL